MKLSSERRVGVRKSIWNIWRKAQRALVEMLNSAFCILILLMLIR